MVTGHARARTVRTGVAIGIWLCAVDANAAPQEAATTAAPARTREERWSRFPVFVWFHGGPAPGPLPFATLTAAGLGGCNVEASDDAREAYAAGLDVYVDHLAGKGDLFLRPPVFERDRARLKDDPLHFRPQRPSGLCDPKLAARLLDRVNEGTQRHRAASPLAYVLDDELSVTRGVNPMDYCFAPETLAAFRTWLAQRNGDVDELNARWQSRWPNFGAIVPPTTGEARAAAEDVALERLNLAAWNAHREFMEAALCGRLVELAARVNELDPGAAIGFTGGSFPSAFGGFDWGRLAPALTLHEPYETGAAPELVRSLARPEARLLSTLFVPDEPRDDWQPRELLARVARGDDGVVAWSSGPLLDDPGAALTAAGRELARFVALARELRAQQRVTAAAPPRVFIAFSQAAARAGWMVDSWADGRTWPNRLTSYESDHASTAAAREGWVELLLALGMPFRFFDERDGLPAEALASPAACVVVLSEAFACAEPLVAALEGFVAAGGSLIGDAHAALFDGELRGRDGKALARLFGVERKGGRTLSDLEGSVAIDAKRRPPLRLAVAEGDALAARPGTRRSEIGFERLLAEGRTLYLDARIGGCVRGEPEEARAALAATATALREWLGRREVAWPYPVVDTSAIGRVELRERRRGGEREWFIVPSPRLLRRERFGLSLEGSLRARVDLRGDATARRATEASPERMEIELGPAGCLVIAPQVRGEGAPR